jgi:hypothetical protein
MSALHIPVRKKYHVSVVELPFCLRPTEKVAIRNTIPMLVNRKRTENGKGVGETELLPYFAFFSDFLKGFTFIGLPNFHSRKR